MSENANFVVGCTNFISRKNSIFIFSSTSPPPPPKYAFPDGLYFAFHFPDQRKFIRIASVLVGLGC